MRSDDCCCDSGPDAKSGVTLAEASMTAGRLPEGLPAFPTVHDAPKAAPRSSRSGSAAASSPVLSQPVNRAQSVNFQPADFVLRAASAHPPPLSRCSITHRSSALCPAAGIAFCCRHELL